MSITQFDNGYWYATELGKFAQSIGIPSAKKLRKDELEAAIRKFLRDGGIAKPPRRDLSRKGIKDVDRGLRLDLPIVLYTNDKETKDFLERESAKLSPAYKRRSGARYRLNRWREEQIAKGKRPTYRALVAEYVRLSAAKEAFAQIPHCRYINFMSDFLAAEKNATREQAIRAWQAFKKSDAPKEYRSWRKSRSRARK
jgi:hypothetical protein